MLVLVKNQIGMSDDQIENEHGAQMRLARAVHEMREAIAMVNHSSAVVKINHAAFPDFIHDELPSEAQWDEKIAEARA